MKRLSQLILLSFLLLIATATVSSAQTYFRLENGLSKLNLVVGGKTDGSNLLQKKEIGDGGYWVMEKQGDLYKIKNKATGLYLSAKGSELVLLQKAGAAAQWNIIKSEKLEGYVQLMNSTNFLTVSSMGNKEDMSIIKFQKPGESGTFWKMVKIKQ